jgi:hypothetical protein
MCRVAGGTRIVDRHGPDECIDPVGGVIEVGIDQLAAGVNIIADDIGHKGLEDPIVDMTRSRARQVDLSGDRR